MALYRVFIHIFSFEPHDNPEKQRYKPSGVPLSHTGSHPGRPPTYSPRGLGKPRSWGWSPFLPLWPNIRPQNKKVEDPESAPPSSPFPDWDPRAQRPAGYPRRLHSLLRPLSWACVSLRTRGLSTAPKGPGWEGGGRLKQRLRGRRMCVTGRVGRGREEARGNPGPAAGSPGSKITREEWGRGCPHTSERVRESPGREPV